MFDEVIRELTAKNSSEQTTSEDVLLWARRIKAHRAQAAITKAQKFDKVKLVQKPKNRQEIETTHHTYHKWPYKYCGGSHTLRQCLAYWKSCANCGKMGHFKKVCRSRRDCTVHEVEVEVMPELQEDRETVSINSIYLNRNLSLIIAHLKMQVDKTTIEVPYKIDTGSEGNIMPLYIYIFKKLFKNMPDKQLKGFIKSNIKLKMYNGTHIAQLGTCAVIIKFKNLKKHCVFFVVPGNSQAQLGMLDTAALNILNLNIDSIQAEVVSYKTKSRKHTQLQRTMQTEMLWEPSNKKPMNKMPEISQTS